MAAIGLIEASVRGRALGAVYDGMEDCLSRGPEPREHGLAAFQRLGFSTPLLAMCPGYQMKSGRGSWGAEAPAWPNGAISRGVAGPRTVRLAARGRCEMHLWRPERRRDAPWGRD